MNIYDSLGLAPTINAWGTMTRLGGALMPPQVLAAMEEASQAFVDVPALQRAAGARISELLGVEAACITAGAAAGMAVAAAACMAHQNPRRIRQLPDTTGMRDEVLILTSHRFIYDQAVLLSGARFVEVGTASGATVEQIEAAITPRTAMFLFAAQSETLHASLPLTAIARMLAPHDIPVLVDAAAELPPRANISRYFDEGASLVVLSGGKEIRGPQSSGLVLGSRYLIDCCLANNYPNVSIGRAMKTDKETIAGLVKAVELFCARDETAIARAWSDIVDELVAGLSVIQNVIVRRGLPTKPDIQPLGIPRAYLKQSAKSPAEIQDELLHAARPIAVGVSDDEIMLNPQCLTADEVPALIEGLVEYFG